MNMTIAEYDQADDAHDEGYREPDDHLDQVCLRPAHADDADDEAR